MPILTLKPQGTKIADEEAHKKKGGKKQLKTNFKSILTIGQLSTQAVVIEILVNK